jgi:hypothetical protein
MEGAGRLGRLSPNGGKVYVLAAPVRYGTLNIFFTIEPNKMHFNKQL